MRRKTRSLKFFASVAAFLFAVSPLNVMRCDEGKPAERPILPLGLKTITSMVILPSEFAAKELRFSDPQFLQIKKIRKDFDLLLLEIADRFSNEDPEMQAESDIHSRIVHAAHTIVQPKLDEVLTPDQTLRLEQIIWQSLGKDFLKMSGAPEYLNLSDRQAARIDKIIYKLEHSDPDSLAFRIRNLLGQDVYDYNVLERKALANVLDVLTSEQKKLVDDLYGKKIDRDELERQTKNLTFIVEYQIWDAESQMKSKISGSWR